MNRFLKITSQINYLYVNICFRLCFWVEGKPRLMGTRNILRKQTFRMGFCDFTGQMTTKTPQVVLRGVVITPGM